MDDYPAYSLDHSIPLLVTLGLPADSEEECALDPGLKEQAILLRSELPVVEGEDAAALSRHIRDGDASRSPWNGRDNTQRYKFRVHTAGRVGWSPGPRDAKDLGKRRC